jgi:hypothetical protein
MSSIRTLALASLTLWSSAAMAARIAETIALPPNAGGLQWHTELSKPDANGANEELLPAGQTDKDWTQMITIRSFPEATDVPKIVANEVQLFADVCKSWKIVETHQGVGHAVPLQVNGPRYGYAKFDVLVRCDEPKRLANTGPSSGLREHEVIWFKGLHGQKGNYLVQRAWHGNTIGPDSVLGSTAAHDEWLSWIDSVGLNADTAAPAK